SQGAHVHADGVGRRAGGRTPYSGDDLFDEHRLSGVGGQKLQQRKLRWGQMQLSMALNHVTPLQVDGEIFELKIGCWNRAGAAQLCADASEQFVQRERL